MEKEEEKEVSTLRCHVDKDTEKRDPRILLGMEAVSTMKISTAVTQEVKNASTIGFSDTDSGYL